MADPLSEFFEDAEFRSTNLTGAASPENLFSMLETLEDPIKGIIIPFTPFDEPAFAPKDDDHVRPHETDDDDEEASLARKKLKFAAPADPADLDGLPKMSHITVERNRRKQMNEHLTVLRSLMPCFYVKRGDQASIIGGVVDYIKELQQVLQSLEAKKQRKAYSEVLSPRPVCSSPRPLAVPLSPRPSPLSPRIAGLPISPRTPQPGSPYKPRAAALQQQHTYAAVAPTTSHESSPSLDAACELPAANSKSAVADVEVKFSGPNVLLNTVSHRIPGQTTKIIAALEGHSLEILHVNINHVDDALLNSFTIKIGIECELSAEELAQEILKTFTSC